MRAWRLPEEFWVQERVQRSPAEKSWQAMLRHQVRAPSYLTRRGRCWTHKASSPPHCRRSASRCASPGFAKIGFANNCEYQGKVRILSSRYRAFRSKTSSRTYGEMHRIARSFDRNAAEDFCEICESSSFSRGFCKAFAKFFLEVQ